ncbi:gamma-aminobutyric acid receptor subunit beta-4-like isoform X2 [Amphibalanus amphitrite]|uniref:gamma-aminobutyric acid receptor subunit beta-4-like isoform X1 n=1 Tax=Amphibalanus amphitrite TaxID=1232801 RepID=UPI001C906EC0|nr:gamma-aminobutyric acid receptor subunit beta-4-like isoform X1 [Amphibalanus amphitrite]XP_043213271.1 gamma-aminobutyric acid receptor subunit beta-4-like isoform X2 [Amphibalanus amphitrite]
MLPKQSDGRSIKIYFTFDLQNVLQVDEENGVLRYQTFFSFAWEDRRLVVPRSARNYSSITLDSDLKERMWLPDIFIFGQEDFEQGRLLQDVGRLHLLTSGHVFLSIYSSYSVGCHLDFSAYPFDVHTCDLIVGSYSQTQEQIEMLWAPRQHAVFEGKALKFNTFSITFQRAGPHTFCFGEGSQRSCRRTVLVSVRLKRSTTFFFFHTFLPCVLLVATSWLSLLLPPDVIPGRMVLCITSLLALLTMYTSSLGSMRVSYIRNTDVWFVGCLLFDFLIILEYAVLLWVQRELADGAARWTRVTPFQLRKEANGKADPKPTVSFWQRLRNPRYMDHVCRWVLAVLFTLFCVVFLAYTLGRKGEDAGEQAS